MISLLVFSSIYIAFVCTKTQSWIIPSNLILWVCGHSYTGQRTGFECTQDNNTASMLQIVQPIISVLRTGWWILIPLLSLLHRLTHSTHSTNNYNSQAASNLLPQHHAILNAPTLHTTHQCAYTNKLGPIPYPFLCPRTVLRFVAHCCS